MEVLNVAWGESRSAVTFFYVHLLHMSPEVGYNIHQVLQY